MLKCQQKVKKIRHAKSGLSHKVSSKHKDIMKGRHKYGYQKLERKILQAKYLQKKKSNDKMTKAKLKRRNNQSRCYHQRHKKEIGYLRSNQMSKSKAPKKLNCLSTSHQKEEPGKKRVTKYQNQLLFKYMII